MKKEIKKKETSLPIEVRKAVEAWETRRKLKILLKVSAAQSDPDSLDPVYGAIQFLVRKGCGASDIIQLLDLLLAYGSDETVASAKRKRDRWLDRASNLVLRLRRDAKDAEELLEFIRSSPGEDQQPQVGANAPQSTEEPESASDSDSDSDQAFPPEMPAQTPPTQADSSDELSFFEPDLVFEAEKSELWDVMRAHADNLDSYIKMEQGYNYVLKCRTDTDLGFLAPEFTRRFGGTLFFLVLAAELIRKATGSPCYAQLATILERVCPQKTLGVEAIVKKINRFKGRNRQFMDEIERARLKGM
jgi:hypothetical protein